MTARQLKNFISRSHTMMPLIFPSSQPPINKGSASRIHKPCLKPLQISKNHASPPYALHCESQNAKKDSVSAFIIGLETKFSQNFSELVS